MLKAKLHKRDAQALQIYTQLLTASFKNNKVSTHHPPSDSNTKKKSVTTPFTLKSLQFSLLLFQMHLQFSLEPK